MRFLTRTASGFTFTGDTGDAELGYTNTPARAMRHEPEAISPEDQERITLATHRAQHQRRLQDWQTARTNLRTAADILLAQQLTRASDVRVLERFIARIDQRIG